MTIKEQEKQLFNDLEKTHSPIVRDGVVNEDEWLNQPVKLVFILKEAIGEKSFHLCEDHLALGAPPSEKFKRHPTWENIARWVYTVSNIRSELPYQKNVKPKGKTPDTRKEWLSKIVALNVKKTPGGSRTRPKQLKEAFEKYFKDVLPRQLQLYSEADVIVCCGDGVLKCLKMVFEETFGVPLSHCRQKEHGDGLKSYVVPINQVPYSAFRKNILIVDFWHPAAFKNNKMMNDTIRDIIREHLNIQPE